MAIVTATIEVANVFPPKEGKKTGYVKTTDDQLYSVWPNDLPRFRPGETVTIHYEEREYNGTVYKTIKSPKGAPRGNPSQLPLPIPSPGMNTKAVEMFVMGTIGRYLQGCGTNFPTTAELTDFVRTARIAFEKGMKDEPKAVEYKDLDDEIPF